MHVGNDIVDLTDPETLPGARHPRFVERVLAPEEATTLDRQAPQCLWAYWSAKESAYKAFRKISPRLPFLPRLLRVTLHDVEATGFRRAIVRCGRLLAAVRIREATDHVHAVATVPLPGGGPPPSSRHCFAPLFRRVESGVRCLPAADGVAPMSPAGSESGCACPCPGTASPSATGRRFLVQRLARRLGCSPSDLSVLPGRRRGVPPAVAFRGASTGIDVSLSHHGRLVAFAFVLPPG